MKKIAILFLALSALMSSCNTKPAPATESDEGFVIKRGLNASHWLSQSEVRGEERAAYMQAADFAKIAAMGFDHVRIPIDEEQMWNEEGQKVEEAFALLHQAIGWAFENDLRVIVDLHVLRSHHFNAEDIPLWTDPQAQDDFWGFWEELSAELIKYPVNKLAYELMNEAVAPDHDDWNKLIAKGIEVVRENEPDRVIVMGSNMWQGVHTFKYLDIPENDENLILSFHYYAPFLLTHHQAPWSRVVRDYKGPVHYPGQTIDPADLEGLAPELLERLQADNADWNAARFEKDMMMAKKVAEEHGLQLFCGEFGAFPSTPLETRVAYYHDIISVFNKLDIAWTHWNYKNDFPVVDAQTLEPIEEILAEMMQ